MAQRAKFYPNIPRDRRPKGNVSVGAFTKVRPVRMDRKLKADYQSKVYPTYISNWIDTNESYTYGEDQQVGTRNPGWRVTIAKGGDATSNYSRVTFKLKPTTYRVRTEDISSISQGYGTDYGGLLVFEKDKTELEDQALARLRNKLQGKVGNAQLMAPIAESREIHRLVRQINGIGMSTLKALLAAHKKGYRGQSIAKQFGDIWLGFGFGINPMLKDIQTAADSILHYVTRQNRRLIVTGSSSRLYMSERNNAISSSIYITAHSSLGYYLSAQHTQGVRYVAGMDLNVRSGSSYSVADHLGLKIEALPSTLWELTPYSWVVDYFTTVGSWVEDMFYTLPGNIVYMSKNYKYECNTTATPKAILVPGASGVLFGKNSFGRYTVFTREKLALALPTRSLRIKSADEIAKNGLTKLLNLGSVLAGRYGPRLEEKTTHQFRDRINPL